MGRDDVHFHEAAGEPPAVPRQLLAPSPYFTGRGSQLAALDAAVEAGAPVVVLTGAGGVGKTALAMYWAGRVLDRFPDGQLHADLGGFDGTGPLDPSEALGRFLRALGVPGSRIPVSLAEQAALYRSVTARRRMLVMLDNAYSAAQVRALLPASASTTVVVTSRARLTGLIPDGARVIEVSPLGTGDAVALLSHTLGPARVDVQRDRAEELARVCGGLPIALVVAAARLTSRPRMSLGRMVADLADEGNRLGGLSVPEGPSVQAAFDVSYRFLHPATAMLYRRLALHPGAEFGPGPAAALMPAIRARHLGDLPADPVDALVEASLLDEVDDQVFRYHDLLRLHARQKADEQEDDGERDSALRAMLEWYLSAAARADTVLTPYRRRLRYPFAAAPEGLPRLAGREEALNWLDRERVNLIAAGRAALDHGWAQLAWQLCDVLWPLFLYRKHYRDRLDVDRRGVAAARAWGDVWAEADMLKRLSRACVTAGDHQAAERHLNAAIERFARVGDERGGLDAREGLATLAEIARLHLDRGRPADALDHGRQALAIFDRANDEAARCDALVTIADGARQLARYPEAIQAAQDAILIGEGAADTHRHCQALTVLADTLRCTGSTAAAHRVSLEALGILDGAADDSEVRLKDRLLVIRDATADRGGGARA